MIVLDSSTAQVCGALRRSERTRNTPVILPTASAHTETRVAATALGVKELTTKPMHGRDLRVQLRRRRLVDEIDDLLRRS